MGALAGRGRWLGLGLAVAGLLLFAIGYFWGNRYQRHGDLQVEAVVRLRPPVALPVFAATDTNGQAFGKRRFEGHWSLLLLGGLDQADTAAGLALETRVLNRLAATPARQQALWPVLLSPDPAADTPERLRHTVAAYNPVLVAASGTTAGLGPLLKALGATPEAPGLYLVDPRMRAVAVIPLRQAPAAVGRDVAALMSADLDRL